MKCLCFPWIHRKKNKSRCFCSEQIKKRLGMNNHSVNSLSLRKNVWCTVVRIISLLNALTFLDSVIWPQTYHNFIYNYCVSQPSNCHVQFEVLHVKPSESLLWGQSSGKEINCFRKTGYQLTLIPVLFPEFPSSQWYLNFPVKSQAISEQQLLFAPHPSVRRWPLQGVHEINKPL